MRACRGVVCFLCWLLAIVPVARAGDATLCLEAIRHTERAVLLPHGLLTAVALSESGRRDPGGGTSTPWPWTVNNGGDGRYFASKQEAIAWIEQLRQDGRRNIDVGCMQVNLMHHPNAFADLDAALDPAINVAYGARFLMALHDETNSWDRAVERYHTAERGEGEAYRARVYANWNGGRPDGSDGMMPAVLSPRPADERTLASVEPGPRFFPISVEARRGLIPLRRRLPVGGVPQVFGPSRPIPGAVSLTPRRLPSRQLAPAPGRIAVLSTGFVTPERPTGAPTGSRVRTAAAGAILPLALD